MLWDLATVYGLDFGELLALAGHAGGADTSERQRHRMTVALRAMRELSPAEQADALQFMADLKARRRDRGVLLHARPAGPDRRRCTVPRGRARRRSHAPGRRRRGRRYRGRADAGRERHGRPCAARSHVVRRAHALPRARSIGSPAPLHAGARAHARALPLAPRRPADRHRGRPVRPGARAARGRGERGGRPADLRRFAVRGSAASDRWPEPWRSPRPTPPPPTPRCTTASRPTTGSRRCSWPAVSRSATGACRSGAASSRGRSAGGTGARCSTSPTGSTAGSRLRSSPSTPARPAGRRPCRWTSAATGSSPRRTTTAMRCSCF